MTLLLARMSLGRPLQACVLGFSLSAAPMLVLGTHVQTWLLAVAFALAGAGLSVVNLSWSLTVQEKVPEALLSRVMSIDGFFSFVAMPIGQIAVGPLAHVFGVREVELGCVALCLVVTLVGATRPAIARVRLEGATRAGGAA